MNFTIEFLEEQVIEFERQLDYLSWLQVSPDNHYPVESLNSKVVDWNQALVRVEREVHNLKKDSSYVIQYLPLPYDQMIIDNNLYSVALLNWWANEIQVGPDLWIVINRLDDFILTSQSFLFYEANCRLLHLARETIINLKERYNYPY